MQPQNPILDSLRDNSDHLEDLADIYFPDQPLEVSVFLREVFERARRQLLEHSEVGGDLEGAVRVAFLGQGLLVYAAACCAQQAARRDATGDRGDADHDAYLALEKQVRAGKTMSILDHPRRNLSGYLSRISRNVHGWAAMARPDEVQWDDNHQVVEADVCDPPETEDRDALAGFVSAFFEDPERLRGQNPELCREICTGVRLSLETSFPTFDEAREVYLSLLSRDPISARAISPELADAALATIERMDAAAEPLWGRLYDALPHAHTCKATRGAVWKRQVGVARAWLDGWRRGHEPTAREQAAAAGWRSPKTVHRIRTALVRAAGFHPETVHAMARQLAVERRRPTARWPRARPALDDQPARSPRPAGCRRSSCSSASRSSRRSARS